MPTTATIDDWAAQVRAGDIRALARAVTAVENRNSEGEALLRTLFPHTGRALRIGVTGAPGTGKSTLVDQLAAFYRSQSKTVGIVAVDPSSPFTGGAILGDRIRMQAHAGDEGVFIRSMAARGFLGGLAQTAGDVCLLLDAAGKDRIVIETVGVGQGEVEIARLADCTVVVLIPGMGDEIQNLKAGLMEIADVFVLNKADVPDAGQFEQGLRAVLELMPARDGWRPPVVRTVATENNGIADLAGEIENFAAHRANFPATERQLAYWKEWLLRFLQIKLLDRALGSAAGEQKFDELAEEVANHKMDPYAAVDRILEGADVEGAANPQPRGGKRS